MCVIQSQRQLPTAWLEGQVLPALAPSDISPSITAKINLPNITQWQVHLFCQLRGEGETVGWLNEKAGFRSPVATPCTAPVQSEPVGQASADWLVASACRVTLGRPCQPCQPAKASSNRVSGGHRYCHQRPSRPDPQCHVNSLRSI